MHLIEGRRQVRPEPRHVERFFEEADFAEDEIPARAPEPAQETGAPAPPETAKVQPRERPAPSTPEMPVLDQNAPRPAESATASEAAPFEISPAPEKKKRRRRNKKGGAARPNPGTAEPPAEDVTPPAPSDNEAGFGDGLD